MDESCEKIVVARWQTICNGFGMNIFKKKSLCFKVRSQILLIIP
jgi:hypothetical protein